LLFLVKFGQNFDTKKMKKKPVSLVFTQVKLYTCLSKSKAIQTTRVNQLPLVQHPLEAYHGHVMAEPQTT
jgi:hypothetical protein